jgi:hypothetical protein
MRDISLMSQTQTVALPGQSRALPVQSRPLVFTAAEAVSVPWAVRFTMTGITLGMVGAILDFAWHMSIGREIFLTPPHIMIGIGGTLVGLACAYIILTTTFGSDSHSLGSGAASR